MPDRARRLGLKAQVCGAKGTDLWGGSRNTLRITSFGATMPLARSTAVANSGRRSYPSDQVPGLSVSDAPLELKKHVGAIHVKGALTLLQRKAVNALLFNAYHELPDDSVKEHSIRISDLARALGFNSKNFAALKDTLGGLVETKVEWNALDPDGREEWGASTLLAGVTMKEGSGMCRYAYYPPLRHLLYNPAVYARINLDIQTRFTSQYALALYENCLRFVRTGSTGWLPVADWRGLLGVGEGQYPAYKAFRQHVLSPAVQQVNSVGHIEVEMETRREGRKIADLRFLIRQGVPTALLGPSSDEGAEGEDGSTNGLDGGLPARLAGFGLTGKQVEHAATLPADRVERNLTYVEAQISQGTKVGKLGAYTYRAIVEDWAGANTAARKTQATLFDGAGASEPEEAAVPPSVAALKEAARQAEEARVDAALRRIDERIDGLDDDARAALDAEAVHVLRDQAYNGWRDVERSVEAGRAADLGPALTGALRLAQRDVMAAWLDRE